MWYVPISFLLLFGFAAGQTHAEVPTKKYVDDGYPRVACDTLDDLKYLIGSGVHEEVVERGQELSSKRNSRGEMICQNSAWDDADIHQPGNVGILTINGVSFQATGLHVTYDGNDTWILWLELIETVGI